MVKISVVMPVYNVEKYLEESINSVLNQTFKNFELICVNDGSTDNSPEILKKYSKYENIKIINQKNSGSGAARNTGLKHSNGDYIYFMDSDDYIEPTTLEDLYNNAIRNDSDIVIYKIARFNDKEVDYSRGGFDLDNYLKDIDFTNYTFNYKKIKPYVLNRSFSACLKLYKKEFLDGYNNFYFDTGILFEDVSFHVKVMLRAEKISFVPKFLYYYRKTPNSIITSHASREDIFETVNIVENFLKENNYYDEFYDEFQYFKFTQISQYIMQSNTDEYFLKSKNELKNINIKENNLVSNIKKENWKMIISSNSLNEYKDKYFNYKYEKLMSQIKKEEEENKKLKKRIHDLETENKSLKDKQYFNKLK